MTMRMKTHGFTLIELMVTLAILGILVSIAYPSYQSSVMKSRRVDAEGVLLGLANAMERHFTETNSYLGAGTTDTGAPSIYTIPPDTATYYTITISAATASSYTLSATPIGTDTCGTLTLDQTGVKGVGSGATVAECW